MKMKKFIFPALVAMSLALSFSACGSSDDPDPDDDTSSKELDYSATYANSWHNYTVNVARLLKADATKLYSAWTESYNNGASYATRFKTHSAGSGYTSALNCIEEIIGGCYDIANEVGTAKIGDPYDLYMSGKKDEALYAVESWYSWHSRDDYRNNIFSIRNSYYGSLDGSVSSKSLSALMASTNPSVDTKVKAAINAAAEAIYNIPQPFRNHINSSEAVTAMNACADLSKVLDKDLRTAVEALNGYDTQFQAIVENYVDVVVLPTYKQLVERNDVLMQKVQALNNNRTNSAFEAACDAWLNAREPWEKSEAFLFGPVDALGLDPNMDSWPLDVDAIVAHLKSNNFADLEWDEDDSDAKIESAQNIRGFHTLEFLLFKNGNPRTVQ
jgi:predicted lipoprotein